MWVKDTYIKLVKDKTAYLAIRKAVQARQGRQPTKDAITAQCDRLLNGNRSNTYDEYLELVDKLINRFNRRTWAEKAFDRIMLDDIALDSLNRLLSKKASITEFGNVITAHLSRLGIIDCPDDVASRALDNLIINELDYIKEEQEPEESKDVILFGKLMSIKSNRTDIRKMFWRGEEADFYAYVYNQSKAKYNISPNARELDLLVQKLKAFCRSKPKLTKDMEEVYDAMDLIMNCPESRRDLMGQCAAFDKGMISYSQFATRIHRVLSGKRFPISQGGMKKLVKLLSDARPKRSGTRTGRFESGVSPNLIKANMAELKARAANYYAQQSSSDKVLSGTTWTASDKATLLRNKLLNNSITRNRLSEALNVSHSDFLERLWIELSGIKASNPGGTVIHKLIFALKEELSKKCHIMPTITVTRHTLEKRYPTVNLTQLNNPPQEESKMNNSNNIGVVKVVTYIDGLDINELSDGQIFGKIQDLENQIHTLGNIKVKSTKLDAKVKELNKAIRGLVKLVDAR